MARGRVFAECNGKLYVKLQYAGIHIFVVACDGLAMTFFGKSRTAYMEVPDVIAWHEKELAETCGRSGNQKVLDALKVVMKKFTDGKIEYTK